MITLVGQENQTCGGCSGGGCCCPNLNDRLKSIKDNTKEREVFQWTRDHKVQQWNGRHSLEQSHQRMMPGHHASHEHSKRWQE